MKRAVASILLLLVLVVSAAAEQVEPYTILIGNNTDQPCSLYLHYKSGDTWETKGWWTVESKKISNLATSTDTEYFIFIQTTNGYFGGGDKRVTVSPYTIIDHVVYDAELPFTRIVAQVRLDDKGNRFFYAELTPQTMLSREVVYRDVYLYNNSPDRTATMSVHFQKIDGEWGTTEWQKIESGHRWLACRTRGTAVYSAARGFVTPPRDAEIMEVQSGLFKTKYYGLALRTGSPYPPVYIDILPIFND